MLCSCSCDASREKHKETEKEGRQATNKRSWTRRRNRFSFAGGSSDTNSGNKRASRVEAIGRVRLPFSDNKRASTTEASNNRMTMRSISRRRVVAMGGGVKSRIRDFEDMMSTVGRAATRRAREGTRRAREATGGRRRARGGADPLKKRKPLKSVARPRKGGSKARQLRTLTGGSQAQGVRRDTAARGPSTDDAPAATRGRMSIGHTDAPAPRNRMSIGHRMSAIGHRMSMGFNPRASMARASIGDVNGDALQEIDHSQAPAAPAPRGFGRMSMRMSMRLSRV